MLNLWIKASYYKNLVIQKVTSKLKGEKGATVAEYALVLALVVVVLIGALTVLGKSLEEKISELTKNITGK